MKRTTKPAFFNIEVPLPGIDEQRRILESVHQIETEKAGLFAKIKELEAEIESKVRVSVPRLIENYDEIKIVRAEFIGKIKLPNGNGNGNRKK